MLLLFVAAFKDGRVRPDEIQLAYVTALKVLLCLVLLTGGNIVKTLVAKLLSSHFHKRAHFDKMQDALNKVTMLPACPLLCLVGNLLQHIASGHRVSCTSSSEAQTAVKQVAVCRCTKKEMLLL